MIPEGYYLALAIASPGADDVTTQLTGQDPVSVFDHEAGLVPELFPITDKDSQTITVVASKEGQESITKVYTLTGLTLEDLLDDTPVDPSPEDDD